MVPIHELYKGHLQNDLFQNEQRVFLVGAFSLKEKSPTIIVGSFFQLTISFLMVHFLQFS